MSKASNACDKAASYEDKMRKEFHNWELDFEPDNDRRPSKFEIWKACAAIKDAEIAELRETADQHFMVGVEAGKNEYREQIINAEKEIASRDLMIKELRGALEPFAEHIPENYKAPCHNGLTTARKCGRCGRAHRAYEALAKTEHHNSRTLEKKLLEAEIKAFNEMKLRSCNHWDCNTDFKIAMRRKELEAKLAELNKE